ncbi:hypothetical protein BHE74_00012761 [Ensete ventricosum]|nr:hypothetical protein GW17_00021672 [Ensete ventricosum]RWW78999.1 hypothetical protein BHE74_00012761 [Ensete ventricosum]
MAGEGTDLGGAVAAVMGEAEGAEGAVGAVEAVHIAFALVGVRVEIALDEEPRRQQRAQPARAPGVILQPSPSLIRYPQQKTTAFIRSRRRKEASLALKRIATTYSSTLEIELFEGGFLVHHHFDRRGLPPPPPPFLKLAVEQRNQRARRQAYEIKGKGARA